MAKKVGGAPKTGNRHKWSARNNGPARERYWRLGTLEKNKVKNLVKYNHMEPHKALLFWRSVRNNRIKT